MNSSVLRSATSREAPVPEFVAESRAFQRVLAEVHRLARCDSAPVLLEGESGTGKTSLARYFHAVSPRAGRAFRSVVLSTLDDSLASSDLFGHVAGAFTDAKRSRTGHFVASHGSTLFLDEIGKASRALQGKLLHAVEYNEVTPVGSDIAMRVDVRIIAATNVALPVLVARGEFLSDLAARFGYFRISVPPLRERRCDIPGLVAQCVARRAPQSGYTSPPAVRDDLLSVLREADWTTNLRGLDSAIQYILAIADGAAELTPEHCGGALEDLLGSAARRCLGRQAAHTEALVRELGSVSAAARTLGVPRSTIQRRLRRACGDASEAPCAGPPTL